MGTLWVREFTDGLDARRMAETTRGGALIRAVDGHITSGREFEQRAAFVEAYELPEGSTKSLAPGARTLYVFGQEAAPSVPLGITYQRLQHPDGSTALLRVASADLYAGRVYAVGVFADGSQHHFYDGTLVEDWVDGRSRYQFQVGGSSGGELTSLSVDGVNILGTTLAWATSNEATAAELAELINNYGSTPDYVAVANGDTVNLLAAVDGTTANGLAVAYTSSGDFELNPTSGTMDDGSVIAAGHFQSGLFAKTVGSKMYALSGPNLHFSKVGDSTLWDSGSTGAGFIDVSTYASGFEELTALAKYLEYLAVFAARGVQIWFVDPDPDNNRVSQVLSNTGTRLPRSVTQFGDNDIFYVDENGLRSLRARDSSNAAATSDVGSPIDPLIIAKLQSMTAAERDKVIGLIEPRDGRFWLVFPDEIFVFSFFPDSKISAWTTYRPTTEIEGEQVAFEIDDAAVHRGKVYLRSGDKVYVYGGLGTTRTYDSTQAEAWLPFLDADTPVTQKHLAGFDAACEGTWEVRIGMQPKLPNASDRIGVIVGTTFNADTVPAQGSSTHFSIRFIGRGSGAKKVSSAVLTYRVDDEED